ncbi:MAG: zinc ribbon domain-containing protein [Thermoplasmata archaeon]|nr:zinc ribbon domain-containing protein [Thermoplasmata archaeon]
MAAERMNYCQALGINPFKEESFDPADADAAIDRLRPEWEKKLQNRSSARMNMQYNDLIARIPDMRSVLRNDVLRHAEFENARRIVAAKASHLRRCTVTNTSGKSRVITTLAAKVLQQMKWDGLTVEDLIKASGIFNSKLDEAATSQIITVFSCLRNMGCYTPEEFINDILAIPGLNFDLDPLDGETDTNVYFAHIDEIYAKRERLAKHEVPGWDAYNDAIVKLHSIRTADEVSKVRLYGETMRAIEPALEMLDQDSGVGFTPDYTRNLITTMLTDVPDQDLAVRILENYCFSRGYPANFSLEESSLVLCPSCKALNAVTEDGACACAYCGAPVRIVCPVCGTVQNASGSVCTGCKIPFAESFSRVDALVTTAREALSCGRTEEAEKTIAELRAEYPHHGYGTLEEDARRVSEKLASVREETSALFRSRRFHGLRALVDESLTEFPFLADDAEIGPRYEKACAAVSEADAICVSASGEEDYISAAEVCPDHPEALAALSTRPPMGPADGNAQLHTDGIVVSYSVPADRRGMVFCIYRGIGSVPEVNSETIPAVETDKGIWLDTSAEPGASCFYRIHSRRWGILSDDYAVAGPCVLVREVTNVRLTPIEDGIRAEYTKPEGCVRVRVWRKRSGFAAGAEEEVEISAGDTGFEDRGLRGNESFSYLFIAEYENGGRSSGTVFHADTNAYPDPVTDLEISWDRKSGLYTAEWSSESPVRLFFSAVRHELPGRITPMKDIESWTTELEPVASEEERMTFRIPPGESGFVTPVITAGTVGIVGDCVLVANLLPISGVTRRNDGDSVLLTFPWPVGSVGAIASIDNRRLEVKRNPGETESTVRVTLGHASRCTVKLVAVYEISGKHMASNAVTTNIWGEGFRRITYTVTATPSRNDRTKTEVQITITCPDAGNLPCCVMVRTREGIPLKATDGEVVWRSDDPVLLANGVARGAFFLPKEDSDITHMRLFLADRSDYSRFRIIHPIHRRR